MVEERHTLWSKPIDDHLFLLSLLLHFFFFVFFFFSYAGHFVPPCLPKLKPTPRGEPEINPKCEIPSENSPHLISPGRRSEATAQLRPRLV
jgi:hypothetical protein